MATKTWVGEATPVKQVSTITVDDSGGSFVTGEIVTITIGAKSLVITIGANVTENGVATTIKEAYENETLTDTTASLSQVDGGQTFPEFREATATVASDVVTLTADSAGVPFTMTASTDSVLGTVTPATATAADGPNFADTNANWQSGSAPTATDDIVLENSSVSILYNLDQIDAQSFTQYSTFTGQVGLEYNNPAGYNEYRETYLDLGSCVDVIIGRGDGAGSSLIKLFTDTAQADNILVESTGNRQNEYGAFIWKGVNALNTMTVTSGSVAIAPYEDDAATISQIDNTTGEIFISRNVTLGTAKVITNQSGSIEFFDVAQDITTLTNEFGTVDVIGSGSVTITTLNNNGVGGVVTLGGTTIVTTANINAGELRHQSSGTITTLNLYGRLDCSQDNATRTITTTNVYRGASIFDPLQTINYGAAPALDSLIDEQRWD